MSVLEKSGKSSQSKFEHTDRISDRRKALFPVETASNVDDSGYAYTDSDSNFSDIQALDNLEYEISTSSFSFFKHAVEDYTVVERTEDVCTMVPVTPSAHSCKSNKSPLCLSPMHALVSSPLLYSPQQTVQPLTPLGKSPTSNLKTPNDTTVKINVKHQKRKLQDVIVDSGENDKSLSPIAKTAKLDTSLHKPKVCTALFPEIDIAVPTKSFYPKSVERTERLHQTFITLKETGRKHSPMHSFGRKLKKRYGQINAGVRHNIKKPKQRNTKKVQIMKAAINILEKSPLNDYLDEIAFLTSKKQINRIEITPKIVAPTVLNENKENSAQSDQHIEVMTNKKFFKSKGSKGIVTINSNIKINVENGKLNLLQSNKRKSPFAEITNGLNKAELLTDLLFEEEVLMEADIDQILTKLGKEKEDLILSPTSQMCDMASGLALNSPKRARLNINAILEGCENVAHASSSVDMKQQKLFPVFYGSKAAAKTEKSKEPEHKPVRWKSLPADQMLLDAGQKRFGVTQCAECQIVYHMGDPNEELMHLKHHNATNVLKFHGWKNERVVSNLVNARIVRIVAGDSKAWWKKVKDLVEVVNRELGFYEDAAPVDNSEIYLYIKNKQIVGCLVAEQKLTAYKMLTSDAIDLCSETSYPVKCGVSRIWVSKNYRKSGVATALMNCLRSTFIYGCIMATTDIAFSSPTELGKQFARRYFKTDNYLVYLS